MEMMRRFALLAFALLLALPAAAAEIKPAVLYAVGQKFDKSFNEGAYEGAMRFKAAAGGEVLAFEPTSPAQFEQGVVAALLAPGQQQQVPVPAQRHALAGSGDRLLQLGAGERRLLP